MKNGRCPKCNAREVYSGAHISFNKGAYGCNTIPLGGLFGTHIPLDNYVCGNCGYVESYINDPDDREKIRRQWERV
ncbi:hypothetical protein ASZ90_010276 [hydrocarbon metagenome]|uniref:Uncharacterized protein n=1 Tax=hydrocarbon metagenome TaxID=938273 RepID=A0A0W8FGF8_9ZZZZ|nr:hypothetical protein [Methanomicrobiaceae archaeon]